MTRFTDSPFELMMSQKPKSGRFSMGEPPSQLPDAHLIAGTHPCKGCSYGRDKPCVGVCMKDLQKKEVPR